MTRDSTTGSRRVGPWRSGRPPAGGAAAGVLLVAAGIVAALLAAIVIRPLGSTTIDPDAAASVLYFDRIVGGHRLEAFVPTTPKPLLTAVYGLAYGTLGDWRALTGLTLVVFAATVPLAIAWTWQTIRPAASAAAAACGAAFAAGTLACWSDLVLEISRANSLVWALAGWLVAGLAMSGERRRPAVAGIALFLAGLARVETLLIVGGTGVALAVVVARGRGRGVKDAPAGGRRPWPRGVAGELLTVALLGVLAVPVACLHDFLLTGDPWFWTSVPARYTELYAPSVVPIGPLEYLGILVARLRPDWPLLALAALGAGWLLARRRWVALTGLGSLGLGSVALLTLLAVRGTYISARYYEPLDLVLLALAAAAPAAVLALAGGLPSPAEGGEAAARRDGRRAARTAAIGGTPALAVAVALGLLAGAAVRWPVAPVDRSASSALELVRSSSAALERYVDDLAGLAGPATLPATVATGAPDADPVGAALFVPSLLRPRIAVETGRPLTALGDTYAAFLRSPAWSGLHAGQHLYHDAAADRPDALDRVLQADPARLGGAVARPVLVDDGAGIRILVVGSP